MNIGLTYNIKKENDSENIYFSQSAAKYMNENILKNYPERIDDTYAEWDSEETINAICEAIEYGGHTCHLIEANEDAYDNLRAIRPNLVFNVAEGFNGSSRESQIPSILEMLDIPFTGSDSISIGICHDKSRCKEILSYYKIPNPPFFISDGLIELRDNIFPKFVKPLHEGSSKGIYNSSIVNNPQELLREVERIKDVYHQSSLIENFVPGKEFTIAMIGNSSEVRVLPIVEINLDKVPEGFNKIYSYEVKWFFDTRENKLDIFKCPADIDELTYRSIEDICKKTFNVLRLRDWSRIDVRLDEKGEANIIEINPLPGILPDPNDNSCFPKAARTAGMDYNQMINEVLNQAIERYNL